MTYNNVEEFLNDKNADPKTYDFSDEGASQKYKDMKGIEKYFTYRAVTQLFVNYFDGCSIKDPDSGSDLLQEIYSLLWDKNQCNGIKYCTKAEKIMGDTLNSVQTTFDEMYKCYEKKEHKKQRGKNNVSIKYMLTRYFCGIEEYKDDFSSVCECEEFLDFLKTYHTLGNFMPVPYGCNAPRGTGKLKDYWDLTLKCIKEYYKTEESKWAEKIVGKKYKTNYAEWLDIFGDWKTFIKGNYLEDFVDDEGEPLELWEGHFKNWENGKYSAESALPKTQDECKEYFKNAADHIEKRTVRMLEVLKRKSGYGKQ